MEKIIQGDCLEVLKTYQDNHFTSVITDPPYMINFMSKEFDKFKDNPAANIDLWKEVLRVSKPGATLLAFGGDRTHHHLMVALENAGWQIKTCLYWIFGSGFPKSTNVSKQIEKVDYYRAKEWQGYGTALKPAAEIIVMAIKKNDGTYASNALKWGVSGVNIDAGRIKFQSDKDKKEACSERPNYKNHNENRAVFDCMNNKGNEKRGNSQGRFPANIILDEESAAMLGDKARFFYTAKASKSERNTGCEGLEEKTCKRTQAGGDDTRGRPTPINRNSHPTVKPLALMEYLINLIMPPKDGLLLDPFAGSGTTLVAAKKLGFSAVGIEREQEYCEIARKRVEAVKADIIDKQMELQWN